MNIQEMHIGVGLGIQKVNSNAFDSFIDEEIDYYLNKAQREYVRRQNVFLKENVENLSRPDKIATSEAAENLGSLIMFDSSGIGEITINSVFDNAFNANIPSEMFQFVYANAQLNNSQGKWVSCKLISPYEIHIYSQSEYNDPLFRRLPLLITKDKFVIFHDTKTTSISKLELMYIKAPATLSLTSDPQVHSDLPEHTHDEIVDIAVNMILGDLKVAGPTQYEQQSIPKER